MLNELVFNYRILQEFVDGKDVLDIQIYSYHSRFSYIHINEEGSLKKEIEARYKEKIHTDDLFSADFRKHYVYINGVQIMWLEPK